MQKSQRNLSANEDSESSKRKNESSPEVDSAVTRSRGKKPKGAKTTGKTTMEGKIDSILSSLAALTQKVENIDGKVDKMSNDLSEMNSRLQKLESAQKETETDIKWMSSETSRLSAELNAVQQCSLSNSFAVYGLPPDLDPATAFQTTVNVAAHLGVNLDKNDLRYVALKKNTARKNSFVLGSFYDERVKVDLLQRFKNSRPLLVEEVFKNLPANSPLRGKEIFIRNQLTKYNRSLRFEAHRLNNGHYKFIWESNGRIMLKKDENSQVIVLSSLDQLPELFPSNVRNKN